MMESPPAIKFAVAAAAILLAAALAIKNVSRLTGERGGVFRENQNAPKSFEDRPRVSPEDHNVAVRDHDADVYLLADKVEMVDQLNQPDVDPVEDVKMVGELVRFYTSAFGSIPPGGENREIVRAMSGDNPRKLAIIPASHEALNDSGEILDRWGSPYYFHPVSGKILEVRSAGPDKILFNDDDVMDDTYGQIPVDQPPGKLADDSGIDE